MKQVASTLKMGATGSSEMSVDLQRTTWRYVLKDRTLHNHRCENILNHSCESLKSQTRNKLQMLFLNGRKQRNKSVLNEYRGGLKIVHGT
jgi:hypothetical protein